MASSPRLKPAKPQLEQRLWKRDEIASALFPMDGPAGMVPVLTYGDGNCLFRAVAQGLHGEQTQHIALREQTMIELVNNKGRYAEEAVKRARALEAASNLCTLSLLQSVLSDSSLAILEEGEDLPVEDALEAAVEKEGQEGRKSGTYSSLLQAMALSTVVGRSIQLVYPDVNASLRGFLNTTVSPLLGSDTAAPIRIMWSALEKPPSSSTFVRLNHFVTLLPQDVYSSQTWMKEDAVDKKVRKRPTPQTKKGPTTLQDWLQTAKSSSAPAKAKTSQPLKPAGSLPSCSNKSKPAKHPCPDTSKPAKHPCPDTSEPAKRPCPDKSKPAKRLCPDKSKPAKRPCPDKSEPDKHPCPEKTEPDKRSGQDQMDRKQSSSTATSSHRSSGFDEQWRKDFPWLLTAHGKDCVEDDGAFRPVSGMFCRLCRKHSRRPVRSPFGKATWVDVPCTTFRRDLVQRHANAECHHQAEQDETHLGLASQLGSVADSFGPVISAQRRAMIARFKCLYWLCKQEIPHNTKFLSLLDLAKALGVEYIDEVCKGGNAQYTSEEFLQEAIQAIASVISAPILADLHTSQFFSVLIDETTDAAVCKDLIMYVKYITSSGEVKTSFLGLDYIANGQASTIFDAVVNRLEKDEGLCLQTKLVGLGSDGAAVMTGCRTGVGKRLQEKVPHLIANHCVAHRLALACAQSADSIPYLKEFKSVLGQLYYFYENSAVRLASLREIQDVINDPHIKLLQAKDTRWLSHHHAVSALHRSYPSVIHSLRHEAEENQCALATGLLCFCRKFQFVATLLLLSDALPPLAQLSKSFQKQNLQLGTVKLLVDGTKVSVQNLARKRGEHLSKLDNYLEEWADLGVEQPTQKQRQSFANLEERYLELAVDHLDQRFPNTDILKAFDIFSGETAVEEQHRGAYGCEGMQTLVRQFSPAVIDGPTAKREWESFRTAIATAPTHHHLRSQQSPAVMQAFVSSRDGLGQLYPNLAKLASLALVLPASTADCERGFSAVNRIKSRLRNRLSPLVLQNLLLVSIEGPPLAEFDFQAACDKWAAMRNRRVCVSA